MTVIISQPDANSGGTVTSVGLTMPTGFSVAGSPIVGAGTFVVTLSTLDASKISGGTFATDAAIFTTDNAAKTPLTVRGVVSQSGDLQKWQNDTPTTIALIDSLGKFSNTTTDSAANPSNSAIAGRLTATGASGAVTVVGISGTVTNTSSSAITGQLRGGSFTATHSGSATLTNAYGLVAIAIADSTGNATSLTGGYFVVRNNSVGGAVVGTGYGVFVDSPTATGTVSDAIGLWIANQTTSGVTRSAIVTNRGNVDINAGGDSTSHFRVRSDTDNANLYSNATTERVGNGTASPATKFHSVLTDSGTNAVVNVVTIGHNGGSVVAGFGTGLNFQAESSTTNDTDLGRLTYAWTTATHASRKARGILTAFDTAERTCVQWEASGTAPMFAVLGTAPIVQQTMGVATAGALYTATEQAMLQTAYDVLRAFGFGT